MGKEDYDFYLNDQDQFQLSRNVLIQEPNPVLINFIRRRAVASRPAPNAVDRRTLDALKFDPLTIDPIRFISDFLRCFAMSVLDYVKVTHLMKFVPKGKQHAIRENGRPF